LSEKTFALPCRSLFVFFPVNKEDRFSRVVPHFLDRGLQEIFIPPDADRSSFLFQGGGRSVRGNPSLYFRKVHPEFWFPPFFIRGGRVLPLGFQGLLRSDYRPLQGNPDLPPPPPPRNSPPLPPFFPPPLASVFFFFASSFFFFLA